MKPKERIIKAIMHQETDSIPYTIDMCRGIYKKMQEYYHDPNFMDRVERYLGYMYASGFPRTFRISDTVRQDEFGTQWDTSVDDFGVMVAPVFTEQTFGAYEFPNPADPRLYSHIPGEIESIKDRFIIADLGMSFFERAWSTYGMENLLAGMAGDEPFIRRLFDRILEYNLKMIDMYLKFDIDCVHVNDDYGQQRGLIMGPKHWRKYIKPGLKIMFERIKSGGKFVYLHSCGDLGEIIPDLVEIGLDILNPLQPETMDVFRIKLEYGKHITLHGGISEQRTMNFGSPDDIECEMHEKMKKLGRGGGYILAPSQAITNNVPVRNVDRFIRVATSQR